MKRAQVLLVLLLVPGCGSPLEPAPLYPSYFLTSVDGKPLPVPFAADGTVLLSGGLGFIDLERPRTDAPVAGTVNYTILVRRPDQSIEHSTIGLNYSISGGVLRIDLCPPLALCIVSTELVGEIHGRTSELILTNYLAGNPGMVYRYFPSLPD